MELKEISLSVIMPVYNEQENIEFTVEKTILEFKNFKKAELIIIDDGSVDDTNNKLIDLQQKYKEIIIIQHEKNQGLGKSLQDGFLKASNDYIIFNSADLPLAPKDIKRVLEQKYPFDLLVLERKKYLGASLYRKFISVCNRIILHIFFPLGLIEIADCNFTIFFKRKYLKNIFPVSKSPGFILAEMILKAKYLKYNVKTVTVDYNARKYGNTIIGGLKDIFESFYNIIYFRFYSFFIIMRKNENNIGN